MEKSLVLIKPDAVERNLVGEILKQYEDEGLKITNLKMKKISRDFAMKHYNEHIGKDFFEKLINYIVRSPLVAVVLSGENAIAKIREINGNTNPKNAKIGTIRAKYGIDNTENCVHASDSFENAEKEISLWFPIE